MKNEAELLNLPARLISESESITASLPQVIVMSSVEFSGPFDFWGAEKEDIYRPDDGLPVAASGP